MGARFLAGLPHGAYFGVASLVAADLAPARPEGARGLARPARAERRQRHRRPAGDLDRPGASGGASRSRWPPCSPALTAVSVLRVVPWAPADRAAMFTHELTALRRPQVWLAIATGAIGGGGMFAIYSYISPILTDRAGLASAARAGRARDLGRGRSPAT